MDHFIDITHIDRRGRAVISHNSHPLGVSTEPLLDGARYLMANGLADPGDTVWSRKDGQLRMRGPVGVAASKTVIETARGDLYLGKYRPFDSNRQVAA
jgi:hypothetical protein